jgi:polysaccharide export outer membrane protein
MASILTERISLLVCLCAMGATGCFSPPKKDPAVIAPANAKHVAQKTKKGFERYDGPLPRELDMVTMPEYTIEPPDILRIDAIRLIPPAPYRVEPLDGLFIQVGNLPMEEPVNGLYIVDPDGTITLGAAYGPPLKVIGMSLEQVKNAVEEHLKKAKILNPKASVSLGQSRAMQQIRGEHLVRPDGVVSLGSYGSVRVVGLTPMQAKQAIEEHLSKYLQKPEVSVEIASYNSKVYYVIYDGAGYGQQVLLMPITGNDTVLRAIAQLNGLPALSSKHRLWIARPAPVEVGRELIMPIDWIGISTKGQSKTNYQLLPGDRLYVSGNRMIAVNTYLSQFLAPFERLFGFALLGNATGRALDGQRLNSGN